MQDSIWFRTLPKEHRRILVESDEPPETAEVVIIGAGLIGICIAYYLIESGVQDICLLDRGPALGEASGANAGGLWFAQQSPELGPVASLAKTSSDLYDELEERFEIGLVRSGLLELYYGKAKATDADRKLRAVRKAGFEAKKLTGKETREVEPSLGINPKAALYYPNEGQVHPTLLGSVLMEHLKSQQVRFVLGADVTGLSDSGKKVTTSKGEVSAGSVVVAAGAWTPQITQSLNWRPPIKPIRGTLLAVGPLPMTLHHTIIGADYYYWQLSDGYVGGGGSIDDIGFERGVDPKIEESIREEMNRLFPKLADQPTASSWSGFRPYCEDGKPVIGALPKHKNVFVAAGHFRKGVMLAPVTGRIIADLLTKGRSSLPISALKPDRFGPARKKTARKKAKSA